jgi:predicted  nucleic acid-binding Zn-ribbon protein
MKREDSGNPSLTKKDISDTFNEFFGKVIEPRFDKIDKTLEENDKKFNDLLNHFDPIYNRLDRLEAEYFTITSGLQRVEKQLVSIEEKLDKEIGIRERLAGEISDLKQRVGVLQRKIEEIEIRLKTIS